MHKSCQRESALWGSFQYNNRKIPRNKKNGHISQRSWSQKYEKYEINHIPPRMSKGKKYSASRCLERVPSPYIIRSLKNRKPILVSAKLNTSSGLDIQNVKEFHVLRGTCWNRHPCYFGVLLIFGSVQWAYWVNRGKCELWWLSVPPPCAVCLR